MWGKDQNLAQLIPSLHRTIRSFVESYEIVVGAGPENGFLEPEVGELGGVFAQSRGAGYGEILREALARASGRYVITMDADFSHQPGYVRTMWHHRDTGEVLIGSRYERGSYAEMSVARRGLSELLNLIYRKILSIPQRDLTSGFRMFDSKVLADIGLPEGTGMEALPEMITKAICQGWRVAEVPFWYQGSHHWTPMKMIKLSGGYLQTLGRLVGLRNSVKAADYDNRAFDSWIPLQRYWQRERFRIIQRFAAEASLILDIGCGTSRIVQNIPDVVGMDLALRKLRWLRAPGRWLLQGDLTRLPFRDASFDAVICSEVIEHMPREHVHLEEFVRVVRPGGLLILSTPDYSRRVWRTLEWIYAKVFPSGYVTEHVNPYTYDVLREELERLGLVVLDCRYVAASEMIFKSRLPSGVDSGSLRAAVTASSR
ncbi:MAG: methyltransferase domain-containing protein [Actinomycetota bacterium]|nr:methyltransferase domain-containing protein [Actinomycetota bacterium]